MPEVEEICNKITVIDHGKVVASGDKESIIDKMGSDREIDVTFNKESLGIDSFKRAIDEIAEVHRCSIDKENDKTVCKIFYANCPSIMESAIKLAVKNKLTITNIASHEPSLEEVFLSLTGKELRDGK